MSGQARVTSKIFASNPGIQQMIQFGSFAAGSTVYTTDPATIQALSNYLDGWYAAVLGDNAPTIEDMNALHFLFSYQISYILSRGMPGYDAGTTYNIGDMCSENSTIYVSLIDSNLGNDPASSPADWKVLVTNPLTTLGDLLYSGAHGVPTRLAGNTSTTPAFLTQTGNGTISAAPVLRPLLPESISAATASGVGTGGFGSVQTGWLFTISTTSTVSVGDVYSNNSNNFTVQYALSAQSGQVLYMSGTGATSGTTLTKVSGAGGSTSSITFSTKVASYTYTVPSSPVGPLWLEIEMVGAGGGAGGYGSSTLPTAGTGTFFGGFAVCPGGNAPSSNGAAAIPLGGVPSLVTSATIQKILAVTGSPGSGGSSGSTYSASPVFPGGNGGATPLQGAGIGGNDAAGTTASPNTGSGGGAGGSNFTNGAATGGAAGAYLKFIIQNPTAGATYPYIIGSNGVGATGGVPGGDGADGGIVIREKYQ